MTELLPASVRDLVEFAPAEDIILALLRAGLPDIPVYSLIPDDPTFPFILARRANTFGDAEGDERFVNSMRCTVQTFTADPDGDEAGSLLSEAVRVVLRNAWLNNTILPGLGSVVRIRCTQSPSRQTDWATSTGPVQYADLPTGTWRYEAQYVITVRRPR